jgi:GMP reductase
MHIEESVKLDYSDVLIRPKRSTLTSRADVNLTREFVFRNSGVKYKGVPIMAANMDTVGTFEMAHELFKWDLFTCIHKHYTIAEWKQAPAYPPRKDKENEMEWLGSVAVSTGTSEADLKKLDQILQYQPLIQYICLDVANGYTESFVSTVKRLREAYPTKAIIAGNVVTGDMTEELILAGADIVKVGIGPGSVCTTRKKAGVGYPQLSAVIECSDAAHGLGGHIIADGGCTVPGDVAKAFGGGADFVMLGGMLAGHDECSSIFLTGRGLPTGKPKIGDYVEFYGMSSKTAQEKHNGSLAEYRASEGKRVLVPYRGPVSPTIQDILGGVRSACTYTGSRKLKELSRRTTFIRVSRQLNEVFSANNAGE